MLNNLKILSGNSNIQLAQAMDIVKGALSLMPGQQAQENKEKGNKK